MRRLLARLTAGTFFLLITCNLCEASARQDEAERYTPPQMLNLNIRELYLDFLYSQDQGTRENKLYGTRTDRNLAGFESKLDTSVKGFVYHPYFLDFNASGAFGYISEDGKYEEMYSQLGTKQDLRTRLDINEYHINAILLKSKPYSVALFADRSISHYDLDLFTRLTTEGQNYGANGRYTTKSWPLTWSFAKTISDAWGNSLSYHNEDLTLSLEVVNLRTNEESRLTYRRQDFLREIDARIINEGIQQQATFSDNRTLGASGKGKLGSNARLTTQDSPLNHFYNLSLDEIFSSSLTKTWATSTSYGYSLYETDDSTSQNHLANATLTHHLFESLTSSFLADGILMDSDGDKTTRMGLGFGEFYTKKLGDSSRLDLAYSHHQTVEDRASTGPAGGTFREYIVLGNDMTFLGATGINPSSVTVRDESETTTYTQGSDYALIQVGERTQIRRLIGGMIPNGAATVVIYQASSGGNARFGTANDLMSFRLHLLNNHVEVYGQINSFSVNDTTPAQVMEGTEKNVGISGILGAFSCGIDYIDSDMSISKYKRLSTYEAMQFTPFSGAQLGLNFQQSRIDYLENDNSIQTLTETLTFDLALWRGAAFHTLASHYNEKILNEGSSFVSVSSSLSTLVGQSQISLGYDFRNSLRTNKSEESFHHTYLRLRRSF